MPPLRHMLPSGAERSKHAPPTPKSGGAPSKPRRRHWVCRSPPRWLTGPIALSAPPAARTPPGTQGSWQHAAPDKALPAPSPPPPGVTQRPPPVPALQRQTQRSPDGSRGPSPACGRSPGPTASCRPLSPEAPLRRVCPTPPRRAWAPRACCDGHPRPGAASGTRGSACPYSTRCTGGAVCASKLSPGLGTGPRNPPAYRFYFCCWPARSLPCKPRGTIRPAGGTPGVAASPLHGAGGGGGGREGRGFTPSATPPPPSAGRLRGPWRGLVSHRHSSEVPPQTSPTFARRFLLPS